MNAYYEVTARIAGMPETLFGSFYRPHCEYEMDAEYDYWKSEGYTSVKIEARWTAEAPSPEVYTAEEMEKM
jgi:hypothetical protein